MSNFDKLDKIFNNGFRILKYFSSQIGHYHKMPYGKRSYGRRPTSRVQSKALARRAYAKGFFAAGPKGPDTFTRGVFGADYKSATPAQRLLRKAVPYKGRGAYWGKALGGWAGGRLGALTGFSQFKNWGEKAGDWASDKAQDFAMSKIRKITGQGLYGGQGEYVNNALIVGGAQSMDVMGNNDETETITIRNYESVMDIYADTIGENQSSPYKSQKLTINPGLFSFSRKLSALAKNYVQYEIKQMVFELRPLISESNVNNGLTGSIMAAVLYDPTAEGPDNKDDLMDISGAVSGKISDHLNIGVECDASKTKDTEYLVRTGPVPIGRDIDEYDHCSLIVGTNNIPSAFSNQAIAELYVYYTIELRMWKPNRDILKDLYLSSTNVNMATTLNPQHSPKGDIDADRVGIAQLNNLGTKLSSTARGIWTLTFPANYSGLVEVVVRLEGTGLTYDSPIITPPAVGVSGNVDLIKDMFAVGASDEDNPQNVDFIQTDTKTMARCRLRVRSVTGGAENTVSILTRMLPTGISTQWTCEVTEYSGQLFNRNMLNPIPRFVNSKGQELPNP